jgi:hypothetical protein
MRQWSWVVGNEARQLFQLLVERWTKQFLAVILSSHTSIRYCKVSIIQVSAILPCFCRMEITLLVTVELRKCDVQPPHPWEFETVKAFKRQPKVDKHGRIRTPR